MRKNVAGQHVAAQVNSRADGSPLTSAVSVFVTIDGGTQTAAGGTATHEGNGHWDYAPTQAETNGNHVAFTFTHATGVNQTVNVYTVSFDPHDTAGLGLSRLDAAVSSRLATAGYTAPPSAADNADAVWDELIAGHLGAGSAGLQLSLAVGLDAAGIRAAIGLAAADLDSQLGALPTAAEIRIEMDATSADLDAIGSLVTAINGNVDVAVSTRLAAAGYTAPDNAGIVAIKAKTDSLNFTVAGALDVNVLIINGVTVQGLGLAPPDHWHG